MGFEVANSITKKCEHCGKTKYLDKFSKSKFTNDGYEKYCRDCRSKEVTDLELFKSYLKLNNMEFNQKNWDSSYDYIKTREVKKHKGKDLPNNFEKIIFEKSINKYMSQSNLTSDLKAEKIDPRNKKPDEKKYYNEKWMGNYTDSDIKYLEDYFRGLQDDFKIVTTNHKDYAMKIAQASLYMNKCYQDMMIGTNGAEARYKSARETFDALSKSAQFAEASRGANDVGLGCFGKVFELVESKTYIPHHTPLDKDDIDKLIDDFKHIFKSL